MILACKQAAFIQNSSYVGDGSGPDIVTIGQNPYQPNLGLSKNIVLNSRSRGQFVDEILYSRLYSADLPIAGPILRGLCPKVVGCECLTGELSGIYGTHFINVILPKIEVGLLDLVLRAQKKLARNQSAESSPNKSVLKNPISQDWGVSGPNLYQELSRDVISNQTGDSINPSLMLSFDSKLESAAQECQGKLY